MDETVQDTLRELQKSVKDRLSDEHPGFLWLGGIAGGAIGFAITNSLAAPIAAGLIVIGGTMQWQKNHNAKWKAFKNGQFVHLLNQGDERVAFENTFGRENYQRSLNGDYSWVETFAAPPVKRQWGEVLLELRDVLNQRAAQSTATVPTTAQPIQPAAPAEPAPQPLPPANPMIAEAVEDVWNEVQRQAIVTPQTIEAANELLTPDLSDAVQGDRLFDLRRLQDADKHPMIALIAPQGGGKSRLIRYLCKYVIFDKCDKIDAAALDIAGRKADWEGFSLVTDPEQMIILMAFDLVEIKRRLQEWNESDISQTSDALFMPRVRVFEEFTDTFPSIEAIKKSPSLKPELAAKFPEETALLKDKKPVEILEEWLRKHGSVTRKLRSRPIFISTELVADKFGMTAGKRNSMTMIFVGESGINMAMADTRILGLGNKENVQLRQELNRDLMQFERGALVYSNGQWFACQVPTLDAGGNPVN